jgi:MFS family permease
MRCWSAVTSGDGRTPGGEFGLFLAGRTVSAFGTALTRFALPLLVYELTGSALNLAVAAVATNLPNLMFGLVIGAWVDRLDRKRLMIGADVVRAFALASIPLLAALDLLTVEWVYGVIFVASTLTIVFEAAQFAALPNLVSKDELVTANGRLRAANSVAVVVGPALGGALLAVVAVEYLIAVDAVSFVVSAASLLLLTTSFAVAPRDRVTSIRDDVVEGVRFVFGHAVLRDIAIMMALVNFVAATVFAQLVFLAKDHLSASDSQVGYLYAAGAVGATCTGLLAGRIRKRLSFTVAALGALILGGVLTVVLGASDVFVVALVAWALFSGASLFFNVNTASLRQQIAPPELLGRVLTIAQVSAWSLSSVGVLVGAWAIEDTGSVATVFVVSGVLQVVIAAGFWAFSSLGRGERLTSASEAAGR